MGNRRSVVKALERAGAEPFLAGGSSDLAGARGVVIPGVGAFPGAMRRLTTLGLADPIRERAQAGTPILGICLGMQLLFERSEELGQTAGLGLLPGEVTTLRAGALPVPHVGWNEVEFVSDSPLTDGLPARAFYHVHSYAARPQAQDDVIGVTEYGERFATIVGRGRTFGVQFHPEKSSTAGLALLERFVALCDDASMTRSLQATGTTRSERAEAHDSLSASNGA